MYSKSSEHSADAKGNGQHGMMMLHPGNFEASDVVKERDVEKYNMIEGVDVRNGRRGTR